MYVDARLCNQASGRSCHASLLFDTSFSLDLCLSEYKARQLGLVPNPRRLITLVGANGVR